MECRKLNGLPVEEARQAFLRCCGSGRWAERMASERPFADVEALFHAARQTWYALDEKDWLEAFGRHPRIGERKSAAGWAQKEQSGVAGEGQEVLAELAQKNREYEERFGFVYLVCATGKSGKEMLEILRERLNHSREVELRAAAEEQAKITRLRLEKLLAELS